MFSPNSSCCFHFSKDSTRCYLNLSRFRQFNSGNTPSGLSLMSWRLSEKKLRSESCGKIQKTEKMESRNWSRCCSKVSYCQQFRRLLTSKSSDGSLFKYLRWSFNRIETKWESAVKFIAIAHVEIFWFRKFQLNLADMTQYLSWWVHSSEADESNFLCTVLHNIFQVHVCLLFWLFFLRNCFWEILTFFLPHAYL